MAGLQAGAPTSSFDGSWAIAHSRNHLFRRRGIQDSVRTDACLFAVCRSPGPWAGAGSVANRQAWKWASWSWSLWATMLSSPFFLTAMKAASSAGTISISLARITMRCGRRICSACKRWVLNAMRPWQRLAVKAAAAIDDWWRLARLERFAKPAMRVKRIEPWRVKPLLFFRDTHFVNLPKP